MSEWAQTTAKSLPGATVTTARYFLTSVDVRSRKGRGTIVAFGDSIPDGVLVPNDFDQRWPGELARRLERRGLPYGVANAGIAGNAYVVGYSPVVGLSPQVGVRRPGASIATFSPCPTSVI